MDHDGHTYLVIPILSLAALLLTITPFAFVSAKAHPGVALYMMWQALNHLATAVNRLVWHGNALDHSPAWCEIAIRIETGKLVGIPASILCMILGIYRVVSLDTAFETERMKRGFLLRCLAVGIGLPILASIFQTIISSERYGIVVDHGCFAPFYPTWFAIPAFGAWPFILSLMTFVYCVLTIIKCRKMRNGRAFVCDSGTNVDQHVSHRALICAGITCVTFFPICTFNIGNSLGRDLNPWPGWKMLKHDYHVLFVEDSRTSDFYHDYNKARNVIAAEHILSSVLFFLIFGTGTVAVQSYSKVLSRLGRVFGVSRPCQQAPVELEMTFAKRDLESAPEEIGEVGPATGPSSIASDVLDKRGSSKRSLQKSCSYSS